MYFWIIVTISTSRAVVYNFLGSKQDVENHWSWVYGLLGIKIDISKEK